MLTKRGEEEDILGEERSKSITWKKLIKSNIWLTQIRSGVISTFWGSLLLTDFPPYSYFPLCFITLLPVLALLLSPKNTIESIELRSWPYNHNKYWVKYFYINYHFLNAISFAIAFLEVGHLFSKTFAIDKSKLAFLSCWVLLSIVSIAQHWK